MQSIIRQFAKTIQDHWVVLTLLLLIVITALSLSPLPELPKVPGTDKTHHFIAYAVLAYPVSLARPKWFWGVLVGMAAFSGCIELIQPYVNRYGEWLDMAANVGGLLTGWVLARLTMELGLLTESLRNKQPNL